MRCIRPAEERIKGARAGEADRAAQIIVLSHDKFFLDAVRSLIHGATCTPFQISASAAGSSIELWDIEREVKEGYLQDHIRLQDFADGGSGDARDMRMVMRPLLERYIRYRFPIRFLRGSGSATCSPRSSPTAGIR
jgi:wobble nucleotide-excising tRNase